jgi:hypothetical protein
MSAERSKWVGPETLTWEQEMEWLEEVYKCTPRLRFARRFGFQTEIAIEQFLKKNPEFKARIVEMEKKSAQWMAEQLLTVHMDENPKRAIVLSNNYLKLMAAKDPERYSSKLDVNVSGQISLRANLEAANNRIGSFFKDVTTSVAITETVQQKLLKPTEVEEEPQPEEESAKRKRGRPRRPPLSDS